MRYSLLVRAIIYVFVIVAIKFCPYLSRIWEPTNLCRITDFTRNWTLLRAWCPFY